MSWMRPYPWRRGPNDDRFEIVWIWTVKTACCLLGALRGRRDSLFQFGKVSCSNVANLTRPPRPRQIARYLRDCRECRMRQRPLNPTRSRGPRPRMLTHLRRITALVSLLSAPLRLRMRITCPDRRSRLLPPLRPRLRPHLSDQAQLLFARSNATRPNAARSLSGVESASKVSFRMPSALSSRAPSKRR